MKYVGEKNVGEIAVNVAWKIFPDVDENVSPLYKSFTKMHFVPKYSSTLEQLHKNYHQHTFFTIVFHQHHHSSKHIYIKCRARPEIFITVLIANYCWIFVVIILNLFGEPWNLFYWPWIFVIESFQCDSLMFLIILIFIAVLLNENASTIELRIFENNTHKN